MLVLVLGVLFLLIVDFGRVDVGGIYACKIENLAGLVACIEFSISK